MSACGAAWLRASALWRGICPFGSQVTSAFASRAAEPLFRRGTPCGQHRMAAPVPERRVSALSARLSGSSDDGSAEPAGAGCAECAEAMAAAAKAQAEAYRSAPAADDAAALARTTSLPLAEPAAGPSPPSALRRQKSMPAPSSPVVAQLRASLGTDRCQHGSSAALALMGSSAESAEDGESPLHDAPNEQPGDATEDKPRGRRCARLRDPLPATLGTSLTLPLVASLICHPTALCSALRSQRRVCRHPTRARGSATRRDIACALRTGSKQRTDFALCVSASRRHISFADDSAKPAAVPSSPSPTSPLDWNALPRRSA